jgi:hypothetical protein
MRISPNPILSTDAGIIPTSSPPSSAPITDPTPMGATVCVSARRAA